MVKQMLTHYLNDIRNKRNSCAIHCEKSKNNIIYDTADIMEVENNVFKIIFLEIIHLR